MRPDHILCDEATSALDPASTISVLDVLRRINEETGVTIVVITHSMEVVERICSNVAVLEAGHVVEQGSVAQVFGNRRPRLPRRFWGGRAGMDKVKAFVDQFGELLAQGTIDTLLMLCISTAIAYVFGTVIGVILYVAYLNDYNEKNDESLVVVAKAHYEPYGIYAGKSSDLANIADGAEIAVPNDPSNEARALLPLQQAGLITLMNPDDIAATPNDIVGNPHHIKFREIEAAATPRALQDVDFAAVNGNYAIEAGLHASDALVVEKASDAVLDQYANIIATRPELASDERLLALAEVLASADFAAYLEKNFGQDVLTGPYRGASQRRARSSCITCPPTITPRLCPSLSRGRARRSGLRA